MHSDETPPETTIAADVVIVGGGTAGSVLAARLSEDPARRVVLVEAGPDCDPLDLPDLIDPYAGRVFMDPRFFWPDLEARHAAPRPGVPGSGAKAGYKQGMVLGGGSSINGQIALRGAPEDYDHWAAAGAAGWDWQSVAPVFRRIETDLDFAGDAHGRDGPVRIRRVPVERWDTLSRAIAARWERDGSPWLADLNADFADGHGPLPFANDGRTRSSASRAYLTAAVRARPNLTILPETRVLRIRIADGRATGVDATRGGRAIRLDAGRVVLTAGALRSPQLLMLSGIGDGEHLRANGVPVVLHRPGVGANLQDHPITSVSAYTTPSARGAPAPMAVLMYRRYSSGVAGCHPSDMVMSAGARSMWHAIGERIFSMRCYIALPYSRGRVALAGPDPTRLPDVDFAGLSDPRDLRRMAEGFRASAELLLGFAPDRVSDVFPARLSRRIEALSRPNRLNALVNRIGAAVMDAAPGVRSLVLRRVVTEGPPILDVLADERRLEDYVASILGTSWHPCGTCRMGPASDAGAVTDPTGAVHGMAGLFVADASLMPRITRTNTNLPTLMIAERIAAAFPR